MSRTILSLGLGLVVALGVSARAEDKPVDKADAKHVKVQIVRVNAEDNTITVRTGTGTDAKEMEYKVNATTKYWGADRKDLTDGLKFKGFKEGADVWLRMGTGTDAAIITELRMFDPAIPGVGDKDKP